MRRTPLVVFLCHAWWPSISNAPYSLTLPPAHATHSLNLERLSMVESGDRSPRASCVSEDGRFAPTLSFARRPTNFSVESVPELA